MRYQCFGYDEISNLWSLVKKLQNLSSSKLFIGRRVNRRSASVKTVAPNSRNTITGTNVARDQRCVYVFSGFIVLDVFYDWWNHYIHMFIIALNPPWDMADPQWNIWYWGSKWNLHTVSWDAVGCEWGTTSVYFGITYVCFIPSWLPVFAAEPQYRH